MSTGMQNGIALPHGKSEGITRLSVAIGIKKDGVNFEALDGQPSKLFILVASPKKISGPHVQFLAAISGILRNPDVAERVVQAKKAEEIKQLLSR